jgi:hypothetical protein
LLVYSAFICGASKYRSELIWLAFDRNALLGKPQDPNNNRRKAGRENVVIKNRCIVKIYNGTKMIILADFINSVIKKPDLLKNALDLAAAV